MPIIDKIQLSGTVYTIGSENSGVTSGEVQTMIDNSLSGYVYTADNGKQDIYGSKTFIGEKRISLTQGTSNQKPGFTIYGTRDAEGNASQLGTFELNPTAITESNTTFPLLSLGHYRSGNRRASVQSYIGFRQYDYDSSAAYHLLAPLPQNAKTPFSLTTSFKNFYMPLGIKVDNSTMVKADSGGVMDISSYIGGGGKAVSGGTNISITTGETADTINCTLPITATTDTTNKAIMIGQSITASNTNNGCVIIGSAAKGSLYDVIIGNKAKNNSDGWNNVVAIGTEAKAYSDSVAIGSYTETYNKYRGGSVAIGYYAKAKNMENAVAIGHEVSTTGTTKTNINNQLKIDSSNQVYISNSANTSTYCLQEKIENTESALGGLKLVKLTQAEYDALATKDSNVLYVIVG